VDDKNFQNEKTLFGNEQELTMEADGIGC